MAGGRRRGVGGAMIGGLGRNGCGHRHGTLHGKGMNVITLRKLDKGNIAAGDAAGISAGVPVATDAGRREFPLDGPRKTR